MEKTGIFLLKWPTDIRKRRKLTTVVQKKGILT